MFKVSALPSVTWDTVRALHERLPALEVTFWKLRSPQGTSILDLSFQENRAPTVF